jgi:hypothetical protein
VEYISQSRSEYLFSTTFKRPSLEASGHNLFISLSNTLFSSQTDFCQFHKYYSLYNFIGNFEEIRDEGENLLKDLGIWSRYGEKGWAIAGEIQTSILSRNASADWFHERYNIAYPPVRLLLPSYLPSVRIITKQIVFSAEIMPLIRQIIHRSLYLWIQIVHHVILSLIHNGIVFDQVHSIEEITFSSNIYPSQGLKALVRKCLSHNT